MAKAPTFFPLLFSACEPARNPSDPERRNAGRFAGSPQETLLQPQPGGEDRTTGGHVARARVSGRAVEWPWSDGMIGVAMWPEFVPRKLPPLGLQSTYRGRPFMKNRGKQQRVRRKAQRGKSNVSEPKHPKVNMLRIQTGLCETAESFLGV